MLQIESRASERVKALVRLRDSAAERREKGAFFAEGLRLCTDIAGVQPAREAYCTQAALAAHPQLAGLARETALISDAVAEKLAGTKNTQGVFCVFGLPQPLCAVRPGGRYVALEHVQDPANVGALLRSAAAFGFEGALLCGGCADPFSQKALRASMGAAVKLGIARYDDALQMAGALRAAGVPLVAAALRDSVPLADARADGARGVAVLVGNEGNGLTDEAVRAADIAVRIPMAPGVESLNAAVAGGVLLWHFRGGACPQS